jgi:hypothetical protein
MEIGFGLMNVGIIRKWWRKKDCIDKLIQVMIKNVNKSIWSFMG